MRTLSALDSTTFVFAFGDGRQAAFGFVVHFFGGAHQAAAEDKLL
jgi:hypothetical protein